MNLFNNFSVKETQEGTTIYLYINSNYNLHEFSEEFGRNGDQQKGIVENAKEYVSQYIPTVKNATVKVVLGSFLISSFAVGGMAKSSPASASVVTEQQNSSFIYKVSSGDALSVIARKFGTTTTAIKEINGLKTDTIFIDQTLRIPSSNYTVVAGDSLSVIAKKYGTSTEVLKNLNQLTSDVIYVGQQLKLPTVTNIQPTSSQTEGVNTTDTYVVQPGDSLSVIAKRYGTTVDKIMEMNNLSTSLIKVGDELKVTNNEITQSSQSNYTVVSGDSLYAIANRYDTTVNAIKVANNLQNDFIYIGQSLTIPTNNLQVDEPISVPDVYIVKSGDSLSVIAKKYDLSANQIKQYNNLTSDTIYVNQRLNLKTQAIIENVTEPTITYKTHTVQSGDNIWDLSVKYGIPQYELLKANNLTMSSVLSLGQALKIPVHNVPVKETVSERHGELLDWWTEAQYVFSIGKTAKVTDFYTGKTFNVKRTIGANHSDTEPLTSSDSAMIKEVWGGNYSWTERPIIVEVDGRKIAASMTSYGHDIDYIKDNNFQGHFDIHFKNSTRHKDGQMTEDHQKNVFISAGVTAQ